MKDLIINGTGDSRFMRSNIPPDTTLPQLIALLNSGLFPFDLNGLNPEGISQLGSALAKATLLDDPVSLAIMGTAGDYTVSQALARANNANRAYGICSTAASTAAKEVTVDNPLWTRQVGAVVTVYHTYAVPANATLNVSTKGAGQIWIGNARITAGVIPAASLATYIWDGTYWRVVAVDRASMGKGIKMQVFPNAGTFTFTAPISGGYMVEVQGAGGAHVQYPTGGGGGYSLALVTLTVGQAITVTVGAEATSATAAGGTSSFGSYATATGGLNTAGGTATGGIINLPGGPGGNGNQTYAPGAGAMFGSGGGAFSSSGNNAPSWPGRGGYAGTGMSAMPGMVKITWIE